MAEKKPIKTAEDRRNNGFYTFNDTKTFLQRYKEKLKEEKRGSGCLLVFVSIFFFPVGTLFMLISLIYNHKTNELLKYYSTEKKRLKLLKKAKGKKSEEEYDRQVFAQIEQYNKPIIAENFYQSAFQKCSLTDLKSAADWGHEKAKQCLATYDAFIELTKVENVDYGALISYAQNSEIGRFAAEYLKTFPISEKCSINDAVRLRDLGNFDAEKMLATIGDNEYKNYKKEAKTVDTAHLEYILGTLRSPMASIDGAIIMYREAITEDLTEDERLEKCICAYNSLQQGLKYVDEEYKSCADILMCVLKYEIWTPYSELAKEHKILPALKNDLALIRQLKKDEKAKAIFDSWNLDMENICSTLISNYVHNIDAKEHPKGPSPEQLATQMELHRISEGVEKLTDEIKWKHW